MSLHEMWYFFWTAGLHLCFHLRTPTMALEMQYIPPPPPPAHLFSLYGNASPTSLYSLSLSHSLSPSPPLSHSLTHTL